MTYPASTRRWLRAPILFHLDREWREEPAPASCEGAITGFDGDVGDFYRGIGIHF